MIVILIIAVLFVYFVVKIGIKGHKILNYEKHN